MPLREQDRAVWVGSSIMPTGSSGKVEQVAGKYVLVDWGSGNERWCRADIEVLTPQQAATRGIEPWATSFHPDRARVGLKLHTELIELIDAQRGNIPRGVWIELALVRAVS